MLMTVVTPGQNRDERQRPAEPREDGRSRAGPAAGSQAATPEERSVVQKPQEVLASVHLRNPSNRNMQSAKPQRQMPL